MKPVHAKSVLIGSMSVGKTALSNSAQGQEFQPNYQATIGTGYYVYKSSVNNNPMELQIWDTAGMERYKSLGPVYYRGADAAIFVYDLTNDVTAKELEEWYQTFRQSVTTPFYGIVVANKTDLVDDSVSTKAMESWADEHELDFIKTSAKTGENVSKLFEMVILGTMQLKNRPAYSVSTNGQTSSNKGCC